MPPPNNRRGPRHPGHHHGRRQSVDVEIVAAVGEQGDRLGINCVPGAEHGVGGVLKLQLNDRGADRVLHLPSECKGFWPNLDGGLADSRWALGGPELHRLRHLPRGPDGIVRADAHAKFRLRLQALHDAEPFPRRAVVAPVGADHCRHASELALRVEAVAEGSVHKGGVRCDRCSIRVLDYERQRRRVGVASKAYHLLRSIRLV
mmetsp:Transcript_2747/g.10815  ORF Transcript_2747/g.10815 Transcript_2747/m.10815 type:complete len:204 (-) Transcript_2747:1020-1631(-)